MDTDNEGGHEEPDIEDEEPDIEDEEPDIEDEEPDIEDDAITKDDLDDEELVRFKKMRKKLGELLIDLRTDYEMGDIKVDPDNELARMIIDGEEDSDIVSHMKSLSSTHYEDDFEDEDDRDYYGGPDDDEENPSDDDFDMGNFLGDSFKMKLDKLKAKILKETSQHQKTS